MAKQKLNIKKLHDQTQGLITGLTQAPPAGLAAVGVLGKSYTIADLLAKLNAYMALLAAVLQAENAVAQASEALTPVAPELKSFVQQTRKSVKGNLGNKSASLPLYGLKADRTPQPLTVEKEATKVARMRATREARHTMGPKQRSQIKGEAPSPPPPPPAPSPPAPSPANAANPSPKA